MTCNSVDWTTNEALIGIVGKTSLPMHFPTDAEEVELQTARHENESHRRRHADNGAQRAIKADG